MKEHDQAIDSGLSLKIIQEILILKYFYYYEFEEIVGTSPNIALLYIAELKHLDYVTLKELLKNINAQNYELFLYFSQDKVSNL